MTKDKSNKNKGLGKGLSSLLGDSAAVASLRDAPAAPMASTDGSAAADNQPAVSGTIAVAITSITPSRWQPRQRFDDDALAELVTSIRHHGVVQPLLVRPHPEKSGEYELIAGERRWRAAQQAGLHELPVLVRDADDQMAAEIALIENVQRHDLSVIEEAAGYRRLMEDFGYTQEKLAQIVGKSRSHLANTMRLLTLPQPVLDMITDGQVTGGQMRPLIGRDDAVSLARSVAARGMSARQVEAMVARLDKPAPESPAIDANIAEIEKKLAEKHGLDIAIRFNSEKGSGKITIACTSLEQFDAMIEVLEGK